MCVDPDQRSPGSPSRFRQAALSAGQLSQANSLLSGGLSRTWTSQLSPAASLQPTALGLPASDSVQHPASHAPHASPPDPPGGSKALQDPYASLSGIQRDNLRALQASPTLSLEEICTPTPLLVLFAMLPVICWEAWHLHDYFSIPGGLQISAIL